MYESVNLKCKKNKLLQNIICLFVFCLFIYLFIRWNKHIGHQDVRHVGCGLKHTVIVLKNGRVFSCGSNEKGQLGQDQTSTRPGAVGVNGIFLKEYSL